jgi:START domain
VRVRRYFYKGIWPTSPRDFIMCSSSRELPDGSILMSTISPPSGMYPDNDGYVRAHINISGMLLKPIDKKFGGGCAITMIGHSDLKGNLPSSILNMLSVGMPTKVMTKLKKILESR